MSVAQAMRLSLNGLTKYKSRSFLMMLGIVVGITTLTVIVSIGKGMQKKVMRGMHSFGPNAVMVTAGGGKMFGPPDEKVTSLTLEDLAAIKESVKGIKHAAPFTMNVEQTIVYGNKNTSAAVAGVTAEWADAWQWYPAKGDFISEEDSASLGRNCLVGQTVVNDLFGGENPIGETIRINNSNFKVIGVLSKRGTAPMGMDMDQRVLIPLSTAMKKMYNVTHIGMIRLYIDDPSRLDEVTKDVASILSERHHIKPPEEDDFRITNTMATARASSGVSKTLTTFLGLLSMISLGVGGIVIANIMFISVNERKREIGIRRAFGATRKDIMGQFLGEALLVTMAGGITGTLLGICITAGLASFRKMPAVISWEPVAIAVVCSSLAGVAAGIQPARKAARLDPVEAIRG